MMPKIAVQIITYANGDAERQDVAALFESLCLVEYPRESWCIVLIDNPSPHGTMQEIIQKEWVPESRHSLPEVFVCVEEKNTGFAGGHMTGLAASEKWNAEYVYLLNQDTIVTPTFLDEVAREAIMFPNAALIQSCIGLVEDRTLLNSRGNALHFLGFGFQRGYRRPIRETEDALPMFYASGAGVLVRVDVIDKIGLFDPLYFMYHEDVDLSWRARLAGYDIRYAESSMIYHRYEFSRSIKKFYWMERNRHVTNLTNYEWKTLLAIFPVVVFMEIGTMIFAIKSGWAKEKVRSWMYFCKVSTWKYIFKRRRDVARFRIVTDSALFPFMCGVITNQEVDNPILIYVVNPILNWYFSMLKGVLF